MNLFSRIILLVIAALWLPIVASAGDSTVNGIIVGQLLTARCSYPLPYANVIVVGTTCGAMTDHQGRYCIRDVPEGILQVRAMMMAYQGSEQTVTVAAGDTVRADFRLRPIWPDKMPARPSGPTLKCSAHGVRMRWVLVPIMNRIVHMGAMRPPNPPIVTVNAWPFTDADPGVGGTKVDWGQSCPVCANELAQWNSNHQWKSARAAPASWRRYVVPGVLELKAPRGLVDSVAVDSCTAEGMWKGTNLRIEIRRAAAGFRGAYAAIRPGPGLPNGNHLSYHVWDVVGDCKASITVAVAPGTTHIGALLASTTDSLDEVYIDITVSGDDPQRTGHTILQSIRFL